MWSIVLRRHVWEIWLKAQQQMLLQEGQRYVPSQNAVGETILVSRGDMGMLAKSFVMECVENLGAALESDEVFISQFNSTISYDAIKADKIVECGLDTTTAVDDVRLDTSTEEAQLDLGTSRIKSLEELELAVQDTAPEGTTS